MAGAASTRRTCSLLLRLGLGRSVPDSRVASRGRRRSPCEGGPGSHEGGSPRCSPRSGGASVRRSGAGLRSRRQRRRRGRRAVGASPAIERRSYVPLASGGSRLQQTLSLGPDWLPAFFGALSEACASLARESHSMMLCESLGGKRLQGEKSVWRERPRFPG